MDSLTAAFHVAHDYPGGVAAIAQVLGKAAGTLHHELHPPLGASAKLGLKDAIKITLLAKNFRILYAFADECGHVCFPRPDLAGAVDTTTQGVLDRATVVLRETAEAIQAVSLALVDGDVTPNEQLKVERECMEAIAAITDVARALREKMVADIASRRPGTSAPSR
jgi:hypothetical protein